MLRRKLDGQVGIETRIGDGLWHTFVDTAQLENAVLNLCIIARDAMVGGGKLSIVIDDAVLDDAYARVHIDVAPGDYVMIAVGDTGSGMPPEAGWCVCRERWNGDTLGRVRRYRRFGAC